MRLPVTRLASLLCLLCACGGGGAGDAESADAAQAKQTTYAECMAEANRQPSRAENVVKAAECMRLPDAPPPGSTLPPGVSPPPGAGGHGVTEKMDAAGEIRSVYTSLAEADCRVIERDEESAGSVSRCPGVAGHALKVLDGDARASIDVVTPDGREHPLHYWSVITQGFSSLGPRAEWRMQGQSPIALIVRVIANEDPENPERTTSYLAVARINPRGICVTDRIAPAPNANEAARQAADASGDRPCLRELR